MLIAVFLVTSCAGRERTSQRHINKNEYLKEHDLLRLPKSSIPVVINDRVIAWMEYFQGPGRKHFRRYLERSGKYMDLMTSILEQNGMPKDLVYISLIESGFNPHAYSRAAAVGAWQFIRGTGKIFKLKIDPWVDERRDVVKSTHAAAAYFKKLHNEFGDWYLAMASYNTGEGRVRRAIKKAGTKDFWELSQPKARLLHSETRDYVPKFIAAMILAKSPEKFGFHNIDYEKPVPYEVVSVPTQTDLAVVAECAGVPEEDVRYLNPELISSSTPHNVKNFSLKIPLGKVDQFRLAYAKIPENDRVRLLFHQVRRGDTLSQIARRYGSSTTVIARANNIRNVKSIHPGSKLIIPTSGSRVQIASRAPKSTQEARVASRSSSSTEKLSAHKVGRGETLGGIANRYGVTVADLQRWNKIRNVRSLRAGQKLKIYGAAEVITTQEIERAVEENIELAENTTYNDDDFMVHTLKSGETLSHIADKYVVYIKDIKAWNGINDARSLKAGQEIKVLKSKARLPKEMALAAADEIILDEGNENSFAAGKSDYKVRSGDTLWSISRAYNISVAELKKANHLGKKSSLRAGQTLSVPAKTNAASVQVAQKEETKAAPVAVDNTIQTVSLPAEHAATPANTTTGYVVAVLNSGETLGHVAERYGVRSYEIMEWNHIKDERKVRAGQKLKIKKSRIGWVAEELAHSAVESAAGTEVAAATDHKVYKVKSGDTLWAIARQHNVAVADLKKWNAITASSLRPGDTLKIVR